MTNDQDILLSLFLLDDIKDEKKYFKTLYSISNNIFANYNVFKIKKRNNKYRTIYAPKKNLKKIQRNILHHILEKIEISDYALAYKKGVSLKDNAYPHLNKKIVLKLDIENFFENINFLTVYTKCFQDYPKNIAYLLTTLCTYGDITPQGAPTSAYISNIVLKEFDLKVGDYCQKRNINYTRYSDDLTFSGDFLPQEVISFIKKELSLIGLALNYQKIAVIRQNNRQLVTGIVVNQKGQVNSFYRKKIRQEVYFINKFGLSSHLEKIKVVNEKKYLQQLLGRISYVLEINNDDLEMKKCFIFVKNMLKTK